MEDIKDRIKAVRQSRQINLSQSAFGERLGVTAAGISRVESGQRNPSEQVILAICREYGVSEHWLRTGEGEMFIKTAEDTLGDIVRSYGLDEEDRIVLEEFVELPAFARKSAILYLRRIAARLDEMEAEKRIPATPEQKNVHDWTDAEMHAELQRQLDAEKRETDEPSTSCSGSSGAATA